MAWPVTETRARTVASLIFCVATVTVCAHPAAQATSANSASRHCDVTGDLRILPFASKIFHNTRMLRVWLPPDYETAAQQHRRYPVLYLNDGQNLFDACSSFTGKEWRVDETAMRLIRAGRVPPMIIVGIDSIGRRDRAKEYLLFPDDTLHPATPVVHGKDYPRFLVKEVMPFIDRKFRTLRDPGMTGIGGSSYGAGIALYAVLQKPGRFGRVLLESPSLYAHDDYLLHRSEPFTRWPDRIFLGVGTVQEPQEDVQRMQRILVAAGRGPGHLRVVRQDGAAHDEDAWAERFPAALEFLYGAAVKPPD